MTAVSRETQARLEIYVENLERWQKSINLVSPKTLGDVWNRHIVDSAQLAHLAEGPAWVDLGSGGGLPGLIVAAIRPDISMTLIESDSRKCAFLRDSARRMDLNVVVSEGRIEDRLPRVLEPDVITARALAPLTQLLTYAEIPLRNGAIGLFPKGQSWEDELTVARESWTFEADLVPSSTDPRSRIMRIQTFQGPARTCTTRA